MVTPSATLAPMESAGPPISSWSGFSAASVLGTTGGVVTRKPVAVIAAETSSDPPTLPLMAAPVAFWPLAVIVPPIETLPVTKAPGAINRP